MAERNFGHVRVGHEVATEESGDGPTVIFRDGSVKLESSIAGRIPLPAERDNGVAVAKKPGVSRVVRKILVAAVHERQNAREPTIVIFEQHRAIPFRRVPRANGNKIGGKFDFAILEIYCVCEINDSLVVTIGNGNREIDFSSDAFVGTSVAEGFPVEDDGARGDFDPFYAGA